MNLKSVKTMQERPVKSTKTITDFYSAKEIEEKYQISYSRLYVIAKENNIPSATLSGKRLFSMEHIDRYFRKLGYKEAEDTALPQGIKFPRKRKRPGILPCIPRNMLMKSKMPGLARTDI